MVSHIEKTSLDIFVLEYLPELIIFTSFQYSFYYLSKEITKKRPLKQLTYSVLHLILPNKDTRRDEINAYRAAIRMDELEVHQPESEPLRRKDC